MILAGFDASSSKRNPSLGAAAQLLRDLKQTYERACTRHLDSLENEPTWGMLNTMYERAFGHAEGCLVLFSRGHYASAEALCRTVIESSTNLYYCAVGNTENKLASYFRQFLQEEREQNRKWRASAQTSGLPAEATAHHLARADQKDAWLAERDDFLRLCFGQFGVDFATAGTAWPSVFDRFKHIGKELTYRTVYAALCSQAHNDAEDLLNALVAGTVDEGRHWDRQMIENEQFALYMVLLSLRSLIEASAIALTRFLPVAEDFRPLTQGSLAQVEAIIQEPPMCDWK